MKCPGCERKLKRIIVVSTCDQNAEIDENGNVSNYEIPSVGKTISVHCPFCDENLLKNRATKDILKDRV